MDDATEPSRLRDHTGYWLRRLSDAVHVAFERSLAAHGVTAAQWGVLAVLYHGEADTPLAVAALLGVDASAVTRLVDRLAAKGLVVRAAAPSDRRSVRVSLTDRGRALVPRLAALADENDARFFGALTAAEQQAFAGLLTTLLAGARITSRADEAVSPGAATAAGTITEHQGG